MTDTPLGSPLFTALSFDSTLSFLADLDGIPNLIPTQFHHQAPLGGHVDSSSDCTKETELNKASVRNRDIPKPKPVKTYQRQKREIETLRAQSCELNAELQRLQQASRIAQDRQRVRRGDSETPLARLWESIVKRQLEDRKRAEVDNLKLRLALESQLRVAQSLEKLLLKRPLAEVECLLAQPKRVCGQPSRELHRLVNFIRVTIASRFDELTEVMKHCNLDTAVDEIECLQTASDGVSMEMVVAKAFPFPFLEVADAVWQCTSAGNIKLKDGSFDASQYSDTLCEVQVLSSVNVRRVQTPLTFSGCGARRIGSSNATIVFESVGVSETALVMNERVVLRERGYVLIEAGESPCGSVCTTVKVCIRLVPEFDNASVREPRVGWLLDLAGGLYEHTAASIFQCIENALVQPSIPVQGIDSNSLGF